MNRKSSRDLGKLVFAHRQESARSYHWAEKAIRYRGEGLWRQAERAEYRVMRSLQRLKQLEERGAGSFAGT